MAWEVGRIDAALFVLKPDKSKERLLFLDGGENDWFVVIFP